MRKQGHSYIFGRRLNCYNPVDGNVISIKMTSVYPLEVACPHLEMYSTNAHAQMQNYTYTGYICSIVCDSKNWG